MKRWAKNLFCLFSLLVFVGSVTLWLRSYLVVESVGWVSAETAQTQSPTPVPGLAMEIRWGHGCIRFYYERFIWMGNRSGYLGFAHARLPFAYGLLTPPRPVNTFYFQFMQFQVDHDDYTVREGWRSQRRAVVPFWLFLPAGIPPLLWWRRWRKNRGRGFPVGVASDGAKEECATETQRPQRAS